MSPIMAVGMPVSLTPLLPCPHATHLVAGLAGCTVWPMPGSAAPAPKSPSPRLWRMRRVQVAGTGVVAAVVAGTAAALTAGAPAAVITVAVVLVAALAAFWFVRNRVRAWTYTEREDDLIVARGVLVRRLSVVPYGRMQFVDVTAGPAERAFRLATVKLRPGAAAG